MSETDAEGADSYTETQSRSLLESIAGSFVAAAFGVLLLCIAIGLIVWNESRSVDAIRGLGQAARDYIEATPASVDRRQDGHLVHLAGALEAHGTLADPIFGLAAAGRVRLRRTVEMYQWKEETREETKSSLGGGSTTVTTTRYEKRWSDEPIDSDGFRHPEGHRNPEMAVRTQTFDNSDVTIGPRTLAPSLVEAIDAFQPLAPPAQADGGFERRGNRLYKGVDPDRPNIGDIRVAFSDVPAQKVSILAAQNDTALGLYRTKHGYDVGLVVPGDVSADEMIAQKRAEEKTLTWILRGVGFLLVFVALLLLGAPLNALANIVPFVGSIVGAGLFAFALVAAIALTLIVIALAWIAVRPLLGLGLVAAALILLVGFARLRRPKPGFLPAR